MAKVTNLKSKPASEPEEKDFDALLDDAIDNIPEEPELPDGFVGRFRIRALTVNAKRGRFVMTLGAIEHLDGPEAPGDLASCRPAFQSFDPTRAGDMRQLSEIAGAAGVDVAGMSRREMIEKKALVGVELEARIEWSPSKDKPGEHFVNVRGLQVPS